MTYGLCIERVSKIAEQELDRVSTCKHIDSWLHLSVQMFLQLFLNTGDAPNIIKQKIDDSRLYCHDMDRYRT